MEVAGVGRPAKPDDYPEKMEQTANFQILTETSLLSFYGLWQLAVCLFAFLALMAIWWHIGRRQNDFGQVWLALSVLCWSFSGGADVYFAKQIQQEGREARNLLDTLLQSDPSAFFLDNQLTRVQAEYGRLTAIWKGRSSSLEGWRSILSLFNSLFILLALPWFRYIPGRIEAVVKSRYWPYIVGLPFLFSLLPTISKMLSAQNLGLISELDVYYAVLTLGFLGLVLWESFAKRRLIILAWLSVVCILVTFVAQLYKLTGSALDLNLFSAIFKTSLIMIFFALALSWVKELAENVIPGPEHLFLSLERRKNESGKYEFRAQLKGIPGKSDRPVALTPAMYDLFLTFARRRREGAGWLEIKPKSDPRSAKTYDIQDHNEIKRLLTALLDGIFGEGSWTRNLHEQPLRTALFELSDKRDRKIRLRLPAEHIFLSAESQD